MTAGQPNRLHPTRRPDSGMLPGSPAYKAARRAEDHRERVIVDAAAAVRRLLAAIDDVRPLDRDGYLEVAVARVDALRDQAGAALDIALEVLDAALAPAPNLADVVAGIAPAANGKAPVTRNVTGTL